jgi:hypothetical protein
MLRGLLLRRGLPKVGLMVFVLVLASAVVLLARSSEPAAAATQGPIASWSFDHEAGSQEDLSENGNTATVEGATWTPHGRYGGAYEFDGEESCVKVEDGPQFQLGEELTLEAWVRPAAADEFSPVFYKQAGETGYGYVLWAGEGEDGVPAGEVNDGTYPEPQIEAKAELPPDVWSHLALTFDGAHMRLYVDGELVATGSSGAPIASEGPLEIGCGNDFGYHHSFDGRIDEPRVYERALSAAEVVADMESPLETAKQSPVAEYSFDEKNEETATDLSEEGHTATLEHTKWTSAGRYGGALEFDGAESCVKVPDSPQLRGGEEFTVEAWVRPAAIEEFLPVFYKQREEDYAYGLWVDEAADGKPAGEINDGTWPIPDIEAKAELPPDVWSHLALTFDGALMRLYVDGQLVATSSSGGPLANEGPLDIGCATVYGFEDHFDGRIDEARVYERALDTAEVDADMEAPIQTPKAGPLAAYSFDEGEPGDETAEDVSLHGHTATLEGGAGWAKGKYGGALNIPNEGCATVPASPELDLAEEFTVEAWVRPEGGIYEDPVVVKESGGDDAFGIGIGSREEWYAEGFIGEGKGSKAAVGGEKIRPYEWVHLAATWDGAKIRLYVDGELASTQAATTPPLSGEGSLRIGCDTPDGSFGGRIDEVRVYGRALNGSEVDTDMESPLQTPRRTPVAEYSFDENDEETAIDITGDGHTATVEGARWTEHGKYGGAYEFKASEEDVLKIPASEELDFDEEFTLEAWVRPSGDENRFAPLIDKQETGGNGYFLYEGGSESDTPIGAVEPGQEHVYAHQPLQSDTWSHVALTFDGNRTYLYVNGEEVQNGAAEPVVTSEGELEIGGSTDTADYFDGRIDEVRIYNRALDLAEVGADMEAPIQTPNQGPIAAWSFDEGTGSTAEDLTGDEHEGTIEGAEWARGKYGDALKFDGEGDVVKVPNSPEFDLTEAFTLEAWVRPESESNEWAPILAKEMGGGEAAHELAWWLYEGGSSSNVPAGGTEPTPGKRSEAAAEDPLPIDVWSHVALTYDGAQIRLYVDGELVDSSPVPAGAPPVTEGELQIGAATELGDHFTGRIDEVRIYDRALTEGEIVGTMNLTFPVAITEPPEELGSNDGVMKGTLEVRGPGTEYFFEYGPTTSYGSVAAGEEVEGNGETVEVEEVAIDLAPETTYHYRLVAVNPLGVVRGGDRTFTTGERTMTVSEEEEEAAEEAPPTEEGAGSLAGPLAAAASNPFFGINWTGDIGQMTGAGDFTAISDSGAKWFRFVVAKDSGYQQAFAEAESHGLTSLPYLGAGAFPKTAHAREGFFTFAKEMMRKYGPNGTLHQIDTWEIWNEPNMFHGEVPAGYEGRVDPKEFAEFYAELVTEMRSVKGASEVHVLAPGLFGYKSDRIGELASKNNKSRKEILEGPLGRGGHESPRTFLQIFDKTLLEEKLENPYQGISLHPYVFKTVGAGKGNEVLHAPADEADAKQVKKEVKAMIRGVQKQAEEDLKTSKPIWVTELGFPVRSEVEGRPDPSIPAVTIQEQALLVRETFAMLKSRPTNLKVEHAMYYNIQDRPGESWEFHAGLLTDTGFPRPAWEAFRKLAGGKACTAAPC